MSTPSDSSSSGGDFDLSGFKSRPRKKTEGEEGSTPSRSPREYGENLPPRPAAGPKRAGKLPEGFKSKERAARPDGPRAPRKPYEAGDAPRKKFASDFRPRDGERPARSYGAGAGDRPFKKFDGPRKPYGERGGDGAPGRAPFGGPRKPYGSDRGGSGGGSGFSRSGGGYPGSRDVTRAAPAFQPELSPDVKKFLPLLTEKGRHKESRFIIEGAKNVADVVEHSPEIIHTVLVADGFQDGALKARLDELRVRTRVVAESDLSALCGTETPQGIVAIANFGSLRPEWGSINSVTLLDGIQDPGNLGAILRTSAALGMDAVVLGKGTCDPYNPKVVRASAAALLRMPLETGEDLAMKLHFLRSKGFTIVATSPHAKGTLENAKLRRKVALLFGSEGGGVGANLIDQADVSVKIPMQGKVESLNVAVAHGLLTYDLMRLKR